VPANQCTFVGGHGRLLCVNAHVSGYGLFAVQIDPELHGGLDFWSGKPTFAGVNRVIKKLPPG
jgi:hypothetical protein